MPKKSESKIKPTTPQRAKPKPKPIPGDDLTEWSAAALHWCGTSATTPIETRRLELTIKCTEMLAREIRALGQLIESSVVSGA